MSDASIPDNPPEDDPVARAIALFLEGADKADVAALEEWLEAQTHKKKKAASGNLSKTVITILLILTVIVFYIASQDVFLGMGFSGGRRRRELKDSSSGGKRRKSKRLKIK